MSMRFCIPLYMPAYQKTDGTNFDWEVLANNSTTSEVTCNVKSGPYYTPSTGVDQDADVLARMQNIRTNHSSVTMCGYVDSAGHTDGTTFNHVSKSANSTWYGNQVNWNNGNVYDLKPQIDFWLTYKDSLGSSLITGIMFDNSFGANTDSTGNSNRDAYYTMIHDNMRTYYPNLKILFGCGGVFPTSWIDGSLGSPAEALFDRINANETSYAGSSSGFPSNTTLAACVTAQTGGVYNYSSDRFTALLSKGSFTPSTSTMNTFVNDCANNNIRYVYVDDNSYNGAMPSFWSSEVTYVATK